MGVSVGITAANAPPGVLWAEMAAMILGRLEFFAIVIGLVSLMRDMPPLARSWFADNRAPDKRPRPSASEPGTMPVGTIADQEMTPRPEAGSTEPLAGEHGETGA